MPRRTASDDLAFGSDSFLDVLANIVGILIILIVLTGLRVSREPVAAPRAAHAEAPTSGETVDGSVGLAVALGESAAWPDDPAQPEIPTTAPPPAAGPLFAPAEPIAEPEPVVAPPPRTDPDPDLVASVAQLERELDSLRATQAALARDEDALSEEEQRLARLAAAKAVENDQAQGTLAALQARLARSREERRLAESHVRRLEAEVADAQTARPDVVTVEHRLTPLSRTVREKELHVRVSGGRVSVIPLEELLSRLKSQIERQKSWLAKNDRSEGDVGPIDGYRLHYLVLREEPSAVDQLRAGGAMMLRLSLARWRLDVQPDLVAQSPDDALRPGSPLHDALRRADPDTTVTCWVYPDSFAAYRTIQSFAHKEGFRVAGRPLPFDVPIAGSPSCSRSSSQ